MFFRKKIDPLKEAKKQEKIESLRKKFNNMTNEQLIIAMILENDSYDVQSFDPNYDSPDSIMGKEAIERCGYNPYEEEQDDY